MEHEPVFELAQPPPKWMLIRRISAWAVVIAVKEAISVVIAIIFFMTSSSVVSAPALKVAEMRC
jgi:hypothetical protein